MATAGEAPRLPSGGWALRQQLWDRGLQEEAEQHRPSMAIAVSDPVAQAFLRVDFGVAALNEPVGELRAQLPPRQNGGPPALNRLRPRIPFGVVTGRGGMSPRENCAAAVARSGACRRVPRSAEIRGIWRPATAFSLLSEIRPGPFKPARRVTAWPGGSRQVDAATPAGCTWVTVAGRVMRTWPPP